MWLPEVFSVIYVIALCAAQDPPEERPTPRLTLETGWRDVFPSETVEFSCVIDGSTDWTFTLLKNEANHSTFPEHVSRLKVNATAGTETYSCLGHNRKTSISSQQSNSEEIKVYDQRPKPALTLSSSNVYTEESVTFKCQLSVSTGWEFLWYHNEREVPSKGDTLTKAALGLSDRGQYECKAKRGTDPFYSEASEARSLQVSEPPTPTLKLQTRWLDVFNREIVEFICDFTEIDWTFTWYRNNEMLSEDDVLVMDNYEGLLNITSVTQAHQGQYSCRAHLPTRGVRSRMSNTADLVVYENVPKAALTKTPAYELMYVGETLNFTCKVSVASGWKYVWYKDGKTLSQTSQSISVYLSPSDGGEYSCEGTRGQTTRTKTSNKIQQDVAEVPLPSLKAVTLWLNVFPTERVSFSCGMLNNSGWTFMWYRNTARVQADSSVSLGSEGTSLSINSASAAHAGAYTCEGHLQGRSVSSKFSSQLPLSVYDKTPTVTINHQPKHEVLFPGEVVSFTCSVDVQPSEWEYQWHKDGNPVASGNKYRVKLLGPTNSGSYHCQAKRGKEPAFVAGSSPPVVLNVQEIPLPSLKAVTLWLNVFPTERVSFSCGMLNNSGWTFMWYRNTARVQADSSVSLGSEGTSLSINSASAAHAGAYTCEGHLQGRSVSSKFSSQLPLSVYDKTPTVTINHQPKHEVLFPGEVVSFTCSVDVQPSEWEYQWHKDGNPVALGNKYRVKLLGPTNSGSYHCQAKRGKEPAFVAGSSPPVVLNVQECPVPSLQIVTPWLDVFPAERVIFSCGMQNTLNWNFDWYKDNKLIRFSDAVFLDSTTKTLTISAASTTHIGNYSCKGHLKSRSVNCNPSSGLPLHVYDEKPRVSLLWSPTQSLLHTGDSVFFRCHVNVSSGWQFLWFKNDNPVATNNNNPDNNFMVRAGTESYKCQVKRGTVAYFSSYSEAITLEVQERPQATITLLTGWSEVFSTDSLVLLCEVMDSHDSWNYTWYKENHLINSTSEKHTVTPHNDPHQSQYTCNGHRKGQPSYSKNSTHFQTKNLLLKRRVLLSISGVIFFGIILVFLGCIAFRIFHKPDDEEQEERDSFQYMVKLQDIKDTSCPLIEFITNEDVINSAQGVEGNGAVCSDDAALEITPAEDQDMINDSNDQTDNGGLSSFQQ